jgi:hypothetical protein
MKLKCDEYDPLTHPTYTEGGCTGCAICRIWSDGDVVCMSGYSIVQTTVPISGGDYFSCDKYKQMEGMCDFGCSTCKNYKSKKDACKLGKEVKRAYIRL